MTWTQPTVPTDEDAADLLTGAWQIALRGVLFDACDRAAPLVVSEFLDGFGVPTTRNDDKFRPQSHGLFASPQYLGGRPMVCSVAAKGASVAAVMDAQADLGWAWRPVDDTDSDLVVPLAFTLADPATKYLVFGKPTRAAFGYKTLARVYESGAPFVEAALCEFLATDPRIYSADLSSTSSGTASTSGGLSFPFAFPFSFGATVLALVSAVNAGNFPTYPVFTITAGPSGLSGIRILNNTTGEEWSITLSLSSGDYLLVDMAEGSVLLNGAASRDSFVNRPPSSWWDLEPGTSSLEFIGTGAGSTFLVEWRSAWML